MMTHPEYETLNDYADGLLSDVAAAATREHLMACSECAETVEQILTLTADARSLPQTMDVPPDVWAAVAAATVETAAAPVRTSTRNALHQLRYHLAAAAIVLLVAASSVTWYFANSRNQQFAEQPAIPATMGRANLVAYGAVEAEYGKAADELMRLLAQRRSTMDTAVVRSVEENLRIMDEAIERARAALLSDPNNNDVAGILTATQESKLRMLRRAVGAAGGT